MKLVCLPGLDGGGQFFAPFMEALGSETSVEPIPYPDDPSLGYVELADLVRERLPTAESYALLAESFSGPTAVQIAAAHPVGLRALILVATFASNPLPLLAPLAGFMPLLPWRWSALGWREWWLMGPNAPRDLSDALDRRLKQLPASVVTARLRAVLGVDVRLSLSSIRVPTLVLRAAQDRIVPQRYSQDLVVGIQGAREGIIDGPHWLLQRRPRECAAAIAEFLTGIG